MRIQERLARMVLVQDRIGEVRWVAGADVAYSEDTAFAAVTVMAYPELEPFEEVVVKGKVSFPYIPGLLSFREGPLLMDAFERLKTRPHIILFDGQGIAHPRGLGLASHLGVLLQIPSIGCAKTRLHGEEGPLGEDRGSTAPIWKGGRIIGVVVRTRKGVRPVYVSPGHMVSMEGAVEWVLKTVRGFRLPEPLRRAHLLAERAKREDLDGTSP